MELEKKEWSTPKVEELMFECTEKISMTYEDGNFKNGS